MIERHRRMRVAVVRGDGEIRVEEQPLPVAGPGELLIKTEVCGVGLDDDLLVASSSQVGSVLGREATGRVAQIGSGVDAFEEGDRVFVLTRVPCHRCRECRRGRPSLCLQARLPVIQPGGFAEYFRVSAATVPYSVWRLPASVSFEVGTLLEPLAGVIRAVALASIRPGDVVAVVGLGFAGMGYLQALSCSPASRVIGLDYSAWRRLATSSLR